MRIAIIGGGAAGIAAAWMLDPLHQVVLFERAPILGGHVRTLGGNVPAPAGLPRLDTGVIELEARNFPTVSRLFDALGLRRTLAPGTTTLFTRERTRLYSPGSHRDEGGPPVDPVALAQIGRHLATLARFRQGIATTPREALRGRPIGELLPDGLAGRWMALLLLYAYSTPLDAVPDIAADLAGPVLDAFADPEQWYSLEGGVWAWMERAIAGLRGEIRVSCAPRAVWRDAARVRLVLPDGAEERFDAVVLAVPPHRVLAVLADPDDQEARCFRPFHGRTLQTTLHRDDGPYRRRGERYHSEFDCFELDNGRGAYNARLDRLAGLPPDGPRYALAWGLDEELDPAQVIWRQPHEVSMYSAVAMACRPAVRANQGRRRTFFAGAWLGDGLHEGAIASAVEVSRRLGGREP